MSYSTDVLLFGVLLVAFAVYLSVDGYGTTASQLFAFGGLAAGLFGVAERVSTAAPDDE